jgi:uncharacterized protein (DUF433 family)
MRGYVLRRLAIETDVIVEQYRQGATFEQLGTSYGCAWQTIRRFLIASEEPLRRPVWKLKLDEFGPDILAAYASGTNVQQIATRYQVQADTVRRSLMAKRLGS